MYLVKTPVLIQNLFPHLIWRMPNSADKVLYLTFDDGPVPEVTEWVMDQLDFYNAKASFFCVGDNVRKYPEIYQEILTRGHEVGNHTFNHLNGWSTEVENYTDNVALCSRFVNSNLFRPPYGKIKLGQIHLLRSKYKIIMWDVLSGDFDPTLSKKNCLNNVIQNSQSGSIIVFHDSYKAEKNLRYALPKVLAHFANLGYTFKKLDAQMILQEGMVEQIA